MTYPNALAADLGVDVVTNAQAGFRTDMLLPYILQRDEYKRAGYSALLIGTNDVGQGVAAATIKANIAAIAGLLHNPRVCTIPPRGATGDKEATRQEVNAWILSEFARPIDLEDALGDGEGSLKEELDSGDGVHPNATGYGVIADEFFEQGFDSTPLVS